ncbi:GNAT family N-acetyltransferase [Thioclava sp. GXIMD4216]|uniref:GNAT family N-acetyltransferase n=1 Tax=unclassified Thioclava TaxID=2621713 RepID=UPI0030D61C18
MTDAAQITIAPMEPAHLAQAHAMSQAVAWPHRREDWALVLGVSEAVVALQGDKVVGTAILSLLGDVGTMNMIIVDAAMRGRGLGRALMQTLLDRAGSMELRLVATADGLPLYRKLGFQAVGEVAQYQGVAQAQAPEQPVREATPEDLAVLLAADRAATGMERSRVLHEIAAQGEVIATQGGVAMIRAFGRGHVIGPILAADDRAARALLSEAACRAAGQFLRVDFAPEHALADHAKALGLHHAGGGIAMVRPAGERARTRDRAAAPAQSLELKTYALVSQALG